MNINITNKPIVCMVSGPNGSGKTTLTRRLLPKRLESSLYLNADEIAKGISPFNPTEHLIDAARVMLKSISKAINSKESFVFETTGSSKTHLKTLKLCKEAGYYVKIIYVYVNHQDIAVRRVQERVISGGHNVDINDIIRRYKRSLNMLFNDYFKFVDEFSFFDNSSSEEELVAKYINKNWQVYNNVSWDKIMEFVNVPIQKYS